MPLIQKKKEKKIQENTVLDKKTPIVTIHRESVLLFVSGFFHSRFKVVNNREQPIQIKEVS